MTTRSFEHAESSLRDDRTIRSIQAALGDRDSADIALTHFVRTGVEVALAATTWMMPAGRLAVNVALNMLARFTARLSVRIVGVLTADDLASIENDLARVRLIDTRPGHTVTLVVHGGDLSPATIVLWIGDGSAKDLPAHTDSDQIIAIGADAWTCVIARGRVAGAIESSDVPFGVLAGVCFGVAEVFKTLLAGGAPSAERAAIRRRFVGDWSYSVWRADRIAAPDATAPAILPPLTLVGVTLVGAGAVGNFIALGLSATGAVKGEVQLFDHKVVDEKNLNRCYYFAEPDLSSPKVDVVARRASRVDLRIVPNNRELTAVDAADAVILVSAVDNNRVRHVMQEALPNVIIEGSTSATTATVSVHTGVDQRTCLVCRHPDQASGLERVRPLTLEEAAAATGLRVDVVSTGLTDGGSAVTDALLQQVRGSNPLAARVLERERDAGADLCGALGTLREELGTREVPQEASVPFVSGFAGVQAAAEVVKLALRRSGYALAPLLDNETSLDLGRDYSRHSRLSGRYPPRADCSLCQERYEQVRSVYASRWRLP
jgi:hypothetical protein